MNDFQEFFDRIEEIGVDRSRDNISRRLVKVCEELGELSEAILNVTCAINYKNKTVSDIMEEAVDCVIVMVDCFMTTLPESRTGEYPPELPDLMYYFASPLDNRMIVAAPDHYASIGAMMGAISRAIAAPYRGELHFHITSALIDMVGLILYVGGTSAKEQFLSIADKKLAKWSAFRDKVLKQVEQDQK